MSKRKVAVVLLVIGVLVFLVSATADALGIGGYPGIGTKQVAGMVVGAALAVVAALRLRPRKG
jgi:hypothetical protein